MAGEPKSNAPSEAEFEASRARWKAVGNAKTRTMSVSKPCSI
jgi:hypothetical protein